MSFTIPRFRSVLITAMNLLTLLIISIVSWLFTVQYEKEAIKHLSHYAHTVAANIASAEVENIITENYASLQGSIFSFLQGAHIESITIASPTGIIIADTQPERLGDLCSGFGRVDNFRSENLSLVIVPSCFHYQLVAGAVSRFEGSAVS